MLELHWVWGQHFKPMRATMKMEEGVRGRNGDDGKRLRERDWLYIPRTGTFMDTCHMHNQESVCVSGCPRWCSNARSVYAVSSADPSLFRSMTLPIVAGPQIPKIVRGESIGPQLLLDGF